MGMGTKAALLACAMGVALPLAASAGEPGASKSASAVAENGRIIFRVSVGGGSFEDIYTMRNDGSGQSPLLAGTTDDRDGTFSPDGTRSPSGATAAAPTRTSSWRTPTGATPSI